MRTSNEFNMRHMFLLNEIKIFRRICRLSKETYERRLLMNIYLQEMHERMIYETDKREEMNRIEEYERHNRWNIERDERKKKMDVERNERKQIEEYKQTMKIDVESEGGDWDCGWTDYGDSD